MQIIKTLSSFLIGTALLTTSLHPIAADPIPTAEQVSHQFSTVAEKTIPAVVSIKVKINSTPSISHEYSKFQDPSDYFRDDFWNRFFDIPQRNSRPSPQIEGKGSGFLISSDGMVITNSHIVRDAESILVILEDGREYTAEIIGHDPDSDIAILKIDEENLPYLTLDDSEQLRIGQWVIAIGNPLGLQTTLTVGVVSAKGRSDLGLTQFEDFIQTDAAINRGNSGGPLLNLSGKVIGMNTAIATSSGGYMGIGFAIPSNMVKAVMEQITSNGGVTRSYLGVKLQKVDQDLAKAFNLEEIRGVLVSDVAKGSPADLNGLKRGDILLSYNDKQVENVGLFRNAISLIKPGTPVKLEVLRDGNVQTITIETAPHPELGIQANGAITKTLGLKVEMLTKDLAKKHGYEDETGVLVKSVEKGSIASFAGVQPGTLILSVNNQKVSSPEEFRSAIENTEKGRPTALLIRKGTITRFISLYVE